MNASKTSLLTIAFVDVSIFYLYKLIPYIIFYIEELLLLRSKNMKKLLTIVSMLIFVASCAPVHKVGYKTEELEPFSDPPIASIGIYLEDARSEDSINNVLFNNTRYQIKLNKKQTCINSESVYKTPVNNQLTLILVNHLVAKQVKAGVSDNQTDFDFTIKAKLKSFYGQQLFSQKAAMGMSFGLVGSLMTSGVKTNGEIIIELSDIMLYNKSGELIANLGDFRKVYIENFKAAPDCSCIFSNLNLKLQEFNEEFSKLIVAKLE